MTDYRLAYCKNGCGWGQVDETGLCYRRCLKSRKVRRQMRVRKEANSRLRSTTTVGDVAQEAGSPGRR